MRNFELYNPTRLFFGSGQISQLDSLIAKEEKVLLVYGGGSIFKNGVYDEVISALKNVTVVEFGGIEPNPRYETLLKAVERIRKENITFILGVGGGSVIDGVKFLAAAIYYEGNPMEIIRQKKHVDWKAMLYGAVLTLPATGSEMNCGAVVTIEQTQEKLSFEGEVLYPEFSICDPRVIASLPLHQIANGLADAFVHVLEQYVTYPQDAPLQDRFSEGILQTLIEVAPKIMKDPTDAVAAANFMWCCTMALNGLIAKGVKEDWVTHAIGHELTVLYGIDHGRSLAIICPSLYRVMLVSKKEKLAQMGRRVFGICGGDIAVQALKTIEEIEAFFHSLGIATKLSLYTEDFEKSADFIVKRFEERGWLTMGEVKNITPKEVREIVEMSY